MKMKMKLIPIVFFATILVACSTNTAEVPAEAATEIQSTVETPPSAEEMNTTIENNLQQVDSTSVELENALNDL